MKTFYSPLRYPGGKSKVLPFMKSVIKENFSDKTPFYIEPYAGGSAVGLGLLIDGHVSDIYINDFDPAIYSFWKCVKNNHRKLIKKIIDTEVSVLEWQKQREIYKKGKIGFELGFATLYLNRCNRSGILKAGCIGGYKQEGKYKIDCRFNKKSLIERIEQIAKYKKQINIYRNDTKKFLEREDIREILKHALLYLDPPYYVKGKELYKNYYVASDHKEISSVLKDLRTAWIVSYDNVPEIQELYDDFNKKEFKLTYFAGEVKKGKEVMFFSDHIKSIPNLDII